jgi:hypothetical protein
MEGNIPLPVIALHAVYVVFGFILMASGMAVARKMKGAGWWLSAHRFLGISGSAFVFAGAIQAIIMVSLTGNKHFNILHAYVGISIVFLALLTPLAGYAQLKSWIWSAGTGIVHRWTGRLILILMLFNFVLGLLLL